MMLLSPFLSSSMPQASMAPHRPQLPHSVTPLGACGLLESMETRGHDMWRRDPNRARGSSHLSSALASAAVPPLMSGPVRSRRRVHTPRACMVAVKGRCIGLIALDFGQRRSKGRSRQSGTRVVPRPAGRCGGSASRRPEGEGQGASIDPAPDIQPALAVAHQLRERQQRKAKEGAVAAVCWGARGRRAGVQALDRIRTARTMQPPHKPADVKSIRPAPRKSTNRTPSIQSHKCTQPQTPLLFQS